MKPVVIPTGMLLITLSASASLFAETQSRQLGTAGIEKQPNPAQLTGGTSADLEAFREALIVLHEQMLALRAELEGLRNDNAHLKSLLQQALRESAPVPADGFQAKGPAEQAQHPPGHSTVGGVEVPAKQQINTEAAPELSSEVRRLSGILNRFQFSGDIRVRYEPIFQDFSNSRYRARLRARLGLEGKLNEDFRGGLFLATGSLFDDPVSTNATLTGFFSRKAIGVDRAWITYQPQEHKWLHITGGKWTFSWLRTPLTFDSDLNPEGFTQKFSFDTKNAVVENITLVAMQLVFNEVPGSTTGLMPGNDSFAIGGQASARLQLGERITTIVAGTVLNWRNADSIIQSITARTLAGNRNTNATVGSGLLVAFASKFQYLDFVADTFIKTAWPELPLRLTLDIVHNPRAAIKQDTGYWGEIGLGRLEHKNDLQFGYSFARVEQDAVLAAFNESEMRAPTNVVQHRIFFQWLVRKNTSAMISGWFGRTLDSNLQNAALPLGLPAGRSDPLVKRLQFDLIHKF